MRHAYGNANVKPDVNTYDDIYANSDSYGGGYGYSYSYFYAYVESDRNSDWYTQLHAWLVCGCSPANARRARGWRLFPSQWKILCDGWALLRRGGQRLHAPI